MKVNIIKIGNSKGVRIPAFILKECNFQDEVNLRIIKGNLVISPVKSARSDWNEIYSSMHECKDNELILNDSIDIDSEDWEW